MSEQTESGQSESEQPTQGGTEHSKPLIRVAIVGAGPAGIYAADLLQKAERNFDVAIDLFEKLPAPYGLVRYGVAPDHPRIKGVVSALREVLDQGGMRLFGGVEFGSDITLTDLQQHYHAVIFATGADGDAPLPIPGVDAEGSYGAADFVSWFDGHPDAPREWPLAAESVAVFGNGNVALDISRMLVKRVDDLMSTEIPANVEEGLRGSPLTELHIFGRRGPADVKFTPLELRELGEVAGVDMVLSERDFELAEEAARLEEEAAQDAAAASAGDGAAAAGGAAAGASSAAHKSQAGPGRNKQKLVLGRIMGQWREAQRAREAGEVPASERRLVFHFWSRPERVEVGPDGRVTGVTVRRTRPVEVDAAGQVQVADTDETETIPVQAVYRAIGYFGSPLAGVPFDSARGVIPNAAGRVLGQGGEPVAGVYATGWVKRGPVGLIGHTKSDAMETLECLIADVAAGRVWQPAAVWPADEVAGGAGDPISELLTARGVRFTTVEGWHRLDAHERALGEAAGRERVKVVPREDMTRISRGE